MSCSRERGLRPRDVTIFSQSIHTLMIQDLSPHWREERAADPVEGGCWFYVLTGGDVPMVCTNVSDASQGLCGAHRAGTLTGLRHTVTKLFTDSSRMSFLWRKEYRMKWYRLAAIWTPNRGVVATSARGRAGHVVRN